MSSIYGRDGGASPYHCVWEWSDDSRFYVGHGYGLTPWSDFEPRPGTELEAWSKAGVVLDWSLAPRMPLTRSAAAQVAGLLRRLRRDQGFTLVRNRVYRGPGPTRPAGGCPSVHALARRLGVSWRQAAKFADSAGSDDFDDDAAA